MSPAGDFLAGMQSGVAVMTTRREGGDVETTVIHSIASYSIDPPSVMFSLPPGATASYDRFGLSLLTTTAPAVSAPTTVELVGAPVVAGALAALSCRPAIAVELSGRYLVVAEVVAVEVGGGEPLLGGGLA